MFDSLLCSKQSIEGIHVYLYDRGGKTELNLSGPDKTGLLNIINDMFFRIDHNMRLYIDSSRAESIMNEQKAFEIVFENETEMITENIGTFKLTKLMIPLSGDLSPDLAERRIIFLTGNPAYSGSPLVSTCDEKTIEQFFSLSKGM